MTSLKREACPIGGEWVTDERWIDVDDPATGAIIGRVPRFGRADTERAIAAASQAMRAWAARTGKDRAAVFSAW